MQERLEQGVASTELLSDPIDHSARLPTLQIRNESVMRFLCALHGMVAPRGRALLWF
jgi:hypothetical protein